jgi:protein-L-isoaspartate(D-aspartate) O-methyltransferase
MSHETIDTRSFERERQEMVSRQISGRGVHEPAVLRAMLTVPREAFVAPELAEFAYVDSPLPIEGGQTISQPFIVALMAAALELKPTDRVLEVGAGSGYAAAVLSRIAAEVFAIERLDELADLAGERCRRLGYDNVRVRCGDGSLGWREEAPFDAIVVAAGGPSVPAALIDQLAEGGRLVIPVGADPRTQNLVRLRNRGDGVLRHEDLGPVRFVPLIGAQGWLAEDANPGSGVSRPAAGQNEGNVKGNVEGDDDNEREGEREGEDLSSSARSDRGVVLPTSFADARADHAATLLVRECAEPFAAIDGIDLGSLIERIGDSRVVLLGECTHGTSEFYRLRAEISRQLIDHHGFNLVCLEGDWPDVAAVDRFVHGDPDRADLESAFQRFPRWMWRNQEFYDFASWLAEHNQRLDPEQQATICGLDLYSLYLSRDRVLDYLDRVDPAAAHVARLRYGCLTPWERDPALYGRAVLSGRYRACETQVTGMLVDLLKRRLDYASVPGNGRAFFDATRNAAVVANAERYYRAMYYGSAASWNLRDRHMVDTIDAALTFYGESSKALVWAHNSHVGDASATEMGQRGETNVGELARASYPGASYRVGFGTDHGTVAAASHWDGPMEIKQVRPALERSYERIFHKSEVPAGALHLSQPVRRELADELAEPRLERAIGVIYRPDTELQSHYFQAILPAQFDSYFWFDASSAVSATDRVSRQAGAFR